MNIGKPYKCHVLAVVDDNQVVFKWYGKHKQWWHYDVLSLWLVEQYIEITKKRVIESHKSMIKKDDADE